MKIIRDASLHQNESGGHRPYHSSEAAEIGQVIDAYMRVDQTSELDGALARVARLADHS